MKVYIDGEEVKNVVGTTYKSNCGKPEFYIKTEQKTWQDAFIEARKEGVTFLPSVYREGKVHIRNIPWHELDRLVQEFDVEVIDGVAYVEPTTVFLGRTYEQVKEKLEKLDYTIFK